MSSNFSPHTGLLASLVSVLVILEQIQTSKDWIILINDKHSQGKGPGMGGESRLV